MKSNNGRANLGILCLAGLLCWWALPVQAQVAANEEDEGRKLEVLTVAGETFTHVRVFQQTASDVMFRHDGGITGFKVQYLDNPTLRRLGYEISPPVPTIGERAIERLQTLPELIPPGRFRWGLVALLGGVVALFAGICLYTGYVFRLICLKSGTRPGFAVWLPVLQALPLLRAARMSWAWFVAATSLAVLLAYAAFRVPEHSLVLGAAFATAIVGLAMFWSVRICHACGRGSVFAVLLLLPGLNYLALVYLAGSR